MKNLVFIFFALFLFFACTEAPKNTPISEAPKEVVSDSMAIAYTIHGFTNGTMSFRWTPLFYGYLPEYRAYTSKYSFYNFCPKNKLFVANLYSKLSILVKK